MNLLKELCAIRGVSGDEGLVKDFVLQYINREQSNWNVKPVVHHGDGFQDCIVLAFGTPRTAVFAHMDSVGYTVGYENALIKVGGPKCADGTILVGADSKGEIECEYSEFEDDEGLKRGCVFDRTIDRGTNLSYKQDWIETEDYVQSCYMDNRLGMWNALKLCETLEDGLIVFSCYEEHGGGTVGFLADFMYKTYGVKQALISDITWVTDGVSHGGGVALSLRDSGIPRRTYINRIVELAKQSEIPYQLEVESAGGSDGNALQRSPYPMDWMFIGAPEDNVHSPQERVYKHDIACMLGMYQHLMKHL